jgi:GH15 family glucan-1,4-alpha-glucosidase
MTASLDLAVVGNCGFAALIDAHARVVWSCLPRYDGDPVFSSLLAGDSDDGAWDIELIDRVTSERRYVGNSAVLETVLRDSRGGAVRIVDFAPRHKRFGRIFRPAMLVRKVELVAGTPRIRIRLSPRAGYGSRVPETTRGSNHIRYLLDDGVIRLTTDAPASLVQSSTPFLLERDLVFLLGPDETIPDAPAVIARDFLERTLDYWQEWCRYLSLPFEWQDAVIRAAITLKLCSWEETGGIVAALTTSIPEAPNTRRTWDYRYCWLRDTFFVVHALNRLSATRTMEDYLSYVTNLVAAAPDGYMQPLFGIGYETKLDERFEEGLPGYQGMGPVRVGNAAYVQVQNDGYGSIIMAVTQCFFDRRLLKPGDVALFRRLEPLGEQAARRWNQSDAGLWEFRTRAEIHTHSAVMCWAACDRLARIAHRLGLDDRAGYWSAHAELIRDAVLERAWNETLGSFVASFGGEDLDAGLLLLAEIGIVQASDPRFHGTVAAIERELKHGDHMMRYRRADDFGSPETAFTVCTLWYAQALAAIGRLEEARIVFEGVLARRNALGLLSEGLRIEDGALWGNFPQTYSMCGLIQCALRLSTPWEGAF